MEELIKNIPSEDAEFITINSERAKYFYDKVIDIKKNNKVEQFIRCRGRGDRKFVHIFSSLLGLNHSSHAACEPDFSKYDCWGDCHICRKAAGFDRYRVIGVNVSTEPIKVRKIDKKQQKKFKNMYKLYEINKKLENGEDENIPNWMIKRFNKMGTLYINEYL